MRTIHHLLRSVFLLILQTCCIHVLAQPAVDLRDKLPVSSGRKASFCNGDVDDLLARFTDFTDTPETKMGIHFRGLKLATDKQRQWLEDATAEPDSLKKDARWQERDIRLYPYKTPLPADVNQSALGDCNVLSLLGEMAYLYPRFIPYLIKQESPRSFRVRMFDPKGKPTVVRVSNKCLTNPKGEIIQCKGKEGIPTWSTILEKAIMKWLKVYKPGTSIEGFGAELMTPLFTGDGRSFSIHPGALSATELQRLVLACLRHGVLVNGGFLRSDVPLDRHTTVSMHGHTFMVPQRQDALFAVRNPWGHGEDDHVMNVTDDGIVPPLVDLRIISPGIALKYFKGEPKPYFSPMEKEVRKEESNAISRKGWKLTWQDNFNKGQLDTSVWSRIPRGSSDWDNTADAADPRLVEFRDGCIVLRGIVNDHPERDKAPHLTGGIWSKDRHPFEVGTKGARFLVRARLHGAQGAWPAIWLMPFDNGPWPTGGEIDIMERLNFDTVAHQTVHTPYTQRHGGERHSSTSPFRPNDFNEYGVDIFPDSLVFHINGHITYTYRRNPNLPENELQFPFFRAQHFRIDQQVGGSWVGRVKDDDLPVEMEVDWARNYLKK